MIDYPVWLGISRIPISSNIIQYGYVYIQCGYIQYDYPVECHSISLLPPQIERPIEQVIKAKDADYPERMATIRGARHEHGALAVGHGYLMFL